MEQLVVACVLLIVFVLVDWAIWFEACYSASHWVTTDDWRDPLYLWLRGSYDLIRFVILGLVAVCYIVSLDDPQRKEFWTWAAFGLGLIYFATTAIIFYIKLRKYYKERNLLRDGSATKTDFD